MSEPNVDAGAADSMIGNGKGELVPECRTLSGFTHDAGCREGVAIGSLERGTTLSVRTRNSDYHLTVLHDNEVIVQGGALFPEAVPALLLGASAGGSLVRTGWIEVGLRMELCVGPERIVTSPVSTIAI